MARCSVNMNREAHTSPCPRCSWTVSAPMPAMSNYALWLDVAVGDGLEPLTMNGRVFISWRNSNKLPSVHQQGVFLTHADVATGAEGGRLGGVRGQRFCLRLFAVAKTLGQGFLAKDPHRLVPVSTPTRILYVSFLGALLGAFHGRARIIIRHSGFNAEC